MRTTPYTELRRFVLILACGLIVGLVFKAVAPVLILTLLGIIGWNMRQLIRLYNWLKLETPRDPPDSHGLWGAVFDDIHRLQRHQLKYRRRLKKIIKRFRDSTTALKDGFVMLDSQGAIDWWNPAAQRLLGLRQIQDKGQAITNLIRAPRFRSYFSGNDFRDPLELASPINTEVELQLQFARFAKDELLLLVRDITEIKRLERVRTDFVANVSHELRTPITVLDGYLETMLDNTDILSPQWHKAMQQMQHQTRRMKILIQDLLMLSRLESGTNNKNHKYLDMAALIQGLASDVRPIIEKRNQTLSIEATADLQLLGHQEEIYSLLSNLVINASKYSPDGARIHLLWRLDHEHGQLSVTDTGEGIADNEIPRLTERFYRVDKSRSQRVGGTGLGLAIVKHILINHDGGLGIQSKLGNGSTFSCHFPPSRIQLVRRKTNKASP